MGSHKSTSKRDSNIFCHGERHKEEFSKALRGPSVAVAYFLRENSERMNN